MQIGCKASGDISYSPNFESNERRLLRLCQDINKRVTKKKGTNESTHTHIHKLHGDLPHPLSSPFRIMFIVTIVTGFVLRTQSHQKLALHLYSAVVSAESYKGSKTSRELKKHVGLARGTCCPSIRCAADETECGTKTHGEHNTRDECSAPRLPWAVRWREPPVVPFEGNRARPPTAS